MDYEKNSMKRCEKRLKHMYKLVDILTNRTLPRRAATMISTKEAIQNAFIELLIHQEYTKISVSSITKTAGINRGTFYLHYKDKDEVLETIQERLFQELEQCVLQTEIPFSLDLSRSKELQYYMEQLFSYIEEYDHVFKILLLDENGISFSTNMNQMISEWLIDGFLPHPMMKLKEEIPKKILAKVAASTIVSFITEWLYLENREPASKMAGYYLRIVMNNNVKR